MSLILDPPQNCAVFVWCKRGMQLLQTIEDLNDSTIFNVTI
jgi:hypothetical protein